MKFDDPAQVMPLVHVEVVLEGSVAQLRFGNEFKDGQDGPPQVIVNEAPWVSPQSM